MRRGRRDEAADVGWPCPMSVHPATARVGPQPSCSASRLRSPAIRRHTGGFSIEERLSYPLRSEVMSGLGAIGAPVDAIQTDTRAASRKPERGTGPLTAERSSSETAPVLMMMATRSRPSAPTVPGTYRHPLWRNSVRSQLRAGSRLSCTSMQSQGSSRIAGQLDSRLVAFATRMRAMVAPCGPGCRASPIRLCGGLRLLCAGRSAQS